MTKSLFIFLSILTLLSCSSADKKERPNVILIMADDMGYECLSCYGSLSYKTPNLDRLAENGIRFSQCVSQPLCTPSRVKIMTGLYNYRNYEYFGYLNVNQYTFGNLMKEAGYATCIAGKWQLNGTAYRDKISDWKDNDKPHKFGFDEYCLWQLTKHGNEGGRYADPLIEQNGKFLQSGIDDYGPDIFSNFILDFLTRNKDKPFFIYYPMVLAHDPFVPTPDSEKWKNPRLRSVSDTANFKDMAAYTDKIVGKITAKVKQLGIEDNTIIIFTGDNGTHFTIFTNTADGIVQGGKGKTIDTGTHVPLIISWPNRIKKGSVYDHLIEFSDFFPTLADIAGKKVNCDGKSFYPLLTGERYQPRKTAFVHYDPRWGKRVNQYRAQFIRTLDYKLYRSGRFFHISADKLEKSPLNTDSLSTEEQIIKNYLEKEIKKHPPLR